MEGAGEMVRVVGAQTMPPGQLPGALNYRSRGGDGQVGRAVLDEILPGSGYFRLVHPLETQLLGHGGSHFHLQAMRRSLL